MALLPLGVSAAVPLRVGRPCVGRDVGGGTQRADALCGEGGVLCADPLSAFLARSRRFYYYADLGRPRRRLVAWCCAAGFLLFVALACAAALFAAVNRTL